MSSGEEGNGADKEKNERAPEGGEGNEQAQNKAAESSSDDDRPVNRDDMEGQVLLFFLEPKSRMFPTLNIWNCFLIRSSMVSDFDLMLERKKAERLNTRRRKRGTDIISDADDLIAQLINDMREAAMVLKLLSTFQRLNFLQHSFSHLSGGPSVERKTPASSQEAHAASLR